MTIPATAPDQKAKLFICFFGDGPYWRDFVLSTAYPSGFSYIWPFRYDEKYVEPLLRVELKDRSNRSKLEGTSAILCARFEGANKDSVLPIRRVTITRVDFSAGVYSFFFRCASMIDIRNANDFSNVTIDLSTQLAVTPNLYLCFRDLLTLPDFLSTDSDVEEQGWAKFCELVCGEKVLPINLDAKKSLFLRFRTPTTGKKPASVDLLYTSSGRGSVYGALLSEGKHYEIAYSHRVPWLEGKNTTIAEIPLDYKLPSSSIELNSPAGTVIGNYQVTHLSMSATKATATWEELVIQPTKKKLTSQNKEEINAFAVAIPFAVRYSFWYRFRQTGIFVFLLWLALTIIGAVASIAELIKDITSGHPIDWQVYSYYIPLSAFASGIAAVAVFLLQERLKNRT